MWWPYSSFFLDALPAPSILAFPFPLPPPPPWAPLADLRMGRLPLGSSFEKLVVSSLVRSMNRSAEAAWPSRLAAPLLLPPPPPEDAPPPTILTGSLAMVVYSSVAGTMRHLMRKQEPRVSTLIRGAYLRSRAA